MNWPIIETPRDRAMKVVRVVADQHKIPVREIFSPMRDHHLIKARMDAYIAVAGEMKHWTVLQVAGFFKRDHSTILHAFNSRGIDHGRRPNEQSSSRRRREGISSPSHVEEGA
jgi:chromosomal replication initiation ATPase DnaA